MANNKIGFVAKAAGIGALGGAAALGLPAAFAWNPVWKITAPLGAVTGAAAGTLIGFIEARKRDEFE